MATITTTEAGALGRYVNLGSPAAHDDVRAQTIIAYCKPTAAGGGGFGYLFCKISQSTLTGPRFYTYDGSGAQLAFGQDSSGVALAPQRVSVPGSVSYNVWQHLEVTWDGTLDSTGINLYINGTASHNSAGTSGSGSLTSDAALDIYLYNRGTAAQLARHFVGDGGYIARWNRVLDDTERANVRANGPLSVSDGLILCWANGQDYSSLALTPTARTTLVAGSTPTNTALGETAQNATATGGTGTGIGLGSGGTASGESSGVAAGGTGAGTGSGSGGTAVGQTFVIRDDYERSSVNLSGSSVTGSGDDAVIVIEPRVTESEILSGETRWGNPSARIDGVNGFRPTFKFSRYYAGDGGYHGGEVWGASQRCFFSYDRITWTPFDTTTASTVTDTITFRHNTAFTQDTVYVGKTRQISPRQVGDWIASMAAAHPGVFVPAPAASAYTPTTAVSSYPAQEFICDEYSAQTNEIGAAVPVTPLYAFRINDTSLMPLDGTDKRYAAIFGGTHASEDTANFVLMKYVEEFLGASSDAVALRRQDVLDGLPMLNAPGRVGGNFRGSFTNGTGGADDLNRHFVGTSVGLEIVDKPIAAITVNRAGKVPDWVFDFHTIYTMSGTSKFGVYDNYPTHDIFRDRLATYSGFGVDNLGNMVVQSVDAYFNGLGTKLTLSHETNDGTTPLTDANIVTIANATITAVKSMIDDGYIIPDAVATGGTGAGTGAGSGGDASGQISATADGGTGTGPGSGTGGDVTIEVGGSATAPGGTGTGPGAGSGGDADGQISADVPGGTGTGPGAGTGGAAVIGTPDAVAEGGTGAGAGAGSGGTAIGGTDLIEPGSLAWWVRPLPRCWIVKPNQKGEIMPLPSKDPEEVKTVTFDFSDDAETITDALITPSVANGLADETPGAVIGNKSIAGGKVNLRVKAGNSGTSYALRCKAIDADGEVHIAVALLPVKTVVPM